MVFHKHLHRMKNFTIYLAKKSIALFEQNLMVEVLESQDLTEPNGPIELGVSPEYMLLNSFQSVLPLPTPERKPAAKQYLRGPDTAMVGWVLLLRKEEGSVKIILPPWTICDIRNVNQQTVDGLRALS